MNKESEPGRVAGLDGEGRGPSALDARGVFLRDLAWERVVALNRAACVRAGSQHGISAENHALCAAEWETARGSEMTLESVLDLLWRSSHREPFLFENETTFAEAAREIASAMFAEMPVSRRRHLVAAVADFVGRTLERECMVEIVENLSRPQSFRPGDRIKTLRGVTNGRVLGRLPDGRVTWRPEGSEAFMISLPENLLKIDGDAGGA